MGGTYDLSAIFLSKTGVHDTVSKKITVISLSDSFGPPVCHDQVITAFSSSLSQGYMVFAITGFYGVHISALYPFESHYIPSTEMDIPRNIEISDDGQWILYITYDTHRMVLISIDGSKKVYVTVNGSPTNACFYRKSPIGTEISYLTNDRCINAIQVDLSGVYPVFGKERTIARLQADQTLTCFPRYAVVEDQIFGRLSVYHDGKWISRTGYLTIPDNGRGIASQEDLAWWKNDNYDVVWGCGHTMSHDGRYTASNPGPGTNICIPKDHKGFAITPFWRSEYPSVEFNSLFDSLSLSYNWCPEEYRPYIGVIALSLTCRTGILLIAVISLLEGHLGGG